MLIIQPTYFSPIVQYAAILQTDKYEFEVEDNFQKQTYRTRCYIYGPNGKQLLNVPTKHSRRKKRRKTRDIKIDNETTQWQKKHIKSLQTAYRSSPFFEFYEDDLITTLKKKHSYLIDLNLCTHEFMMDALKEKCLYTRSTKFEIKPKNKSDLRAFADEEIKNEISFPKYIQIFDYKFGFLKNLSILDLLFMEGPNSTSYLKKIRF